MSTKSKTFGYGLVGSGSKVLMFTGTEQAFVNGDKTTFTIGSASTATIGTKLDFQVGPSYSFKNFNPSEWGTPTNIEAITKWGEAQGWPEAADSLPRVSPRLRGQAFCFPLEAS